MLDQGACAAVEDPGYPPPRRLLESLGARVVAVPVDQEGLVVDALPNDARLVYCSPSHQFPLGMAMSLGRRIPLLAWAAQKGAAIIEDGTIQDMLNVLRAQAAGISLFPLSDLTVGQAQPGLVIGYGAIPLERIDEGLHRLRACLEP
jgi:DNA-binding transcriptional MocR family regulator